MLDKDFITQRETALEKEKQELQTELDSFAQKRKQGPENWDTKFPNFQTSSVEEEADEVEEFQNLLPVEQFLETKLKEIKIALEKMRQAGRYGKCEKCQKEIEKERLETIPETRYCHQCKK